MKTVSSLQVAQPCLVNYFTSSIIPISNLYSPHIHDAMDIEAKQNETHPKRRLPLRREGYTSLAAWMTLDPDNEALIFRKFDYLSARRTLHLQSQLLELEDRLRELDASVSQDVESKKSLRKHEVFVERAKSGSGPGHERMELLDRIHQKLDEYRNEFASRCSKIIV